MKWTKKVMETITNVIEKNILLIKIFSITDIRYHPPYKQQKYQVW